MNSLILLGRGEVNHILVALLLIKRLKQLFYIYRFGQKYLNKILLIETLDIRYNPVINTIYAFYFNCISCKVHPIDS